MPCLLTGESSAKDFATERNMVMTKREWANETVRLLTEIVKADREGRIRDRVILCAKHDDMIANPDKYITD